MNSLLRGSAGAASAMFMVGTLAAVSSVIGGYPLYGGQALRYALAAAILFVVAGARGRRLVVRLTLRESLLLLALAATGLVLFNVCVIEATRRAGPALVGTIVGAVPVVLAVVGPLLTRSRPSGRVLAAAAVVVVGASVTTGFGSGNLTGLVYAVGALGCEACFSLLAVPLLPRLGPLRVSAYTEAAAVPLLLVIGVIADGDGLFRMPSLAEAATLVYLGTVVSAGAFVLWYDALPRLGADRAGLFAGVIPVGAIVTTVLLGLGAPTATELGGAAVVVSGLILGLASAARDHGHSRSVPSATGAVLQPPALLGDTDCLQPVPRPDLSDGRGQVVPHGSLGQVEAGGDLRDRGPVGRGGQNVTLALGQRVRVGSQGGDRQRGVDDLPAVQDVPDGLGERLHRSVLDHEPGRAGLDRPP
jgi:drug/metabolite transporter (DMT)-like permease